jgi:hypothetical protein
MIRGSSMMTRSCIVLVFLFALAPATAMTDCDLLRKFNAVQSKSDCGRRGAGLLRAVEFLFERNAAPAHW